VAKVAGGGDPKLNCGGNGGFYLFQKKLGKGEKPIENGPTPSRVGRFKGGKRVRKRHPERPYLHRFTSKNGEGMATTAVDH